MGKSNDSIHGFLNLNKPFGITAHDCISRLRKILQQKRIGHSGTLDPAATGVLPIALGQVTRLIRFLPEGKSYKATIRFGLVTATDDLEGNVITQHACPDLTLGAVEQLLPQFLGKIQQRPPAFSAIQVQGKRLYDLARAGEVVEAPIRTVEVRSIQVLAWRHGDFPEIVVSIDCGTGTYIRSIARDLGEKLGCGGTLAGLERTHSNGFDLSNSVTFEVVEAQKLDQNFNLTPPSIALAHLPSIALDSETAKRWSCGQAIGQESIDLEAIPTGDYLRVYNKKDDEKDDLIGIGEWQGQNLCPVVVLSLIN